MTVVKQAVIVAVLWACGTALNTAFAQAEPGVYAGVFLGSTDSEGTPSGFSQTGFGAFGVATTGPTTGSEDAKDSGYGFQVGYRFNRWLALEGGYIDLGDTTFRGTAPGVLVFDPDNTADTFTQKLTSNISGFVLSVLGVVPINYRFEAYGRAGLLIGNDELDVRAANSTSSGSFDVSQSSTDPILGVGVSFALAEIYSIRAEIMRVLDAGDAISGANDIDVLALGFTVRF